MQDALDDYHWLVGEAARPWLARVADELRVSRGPGTSLLTRLRKEMSAERAHLIVEQCELRVRARDKFSQAERMFFTRKGLEQATDEQVAACKAGRFPAGSLADLCCGVGGDLLALASVGSAAGFEIDPVVRFLAEANAAACGLSRQQCRVSGENAAQCPAGEFAAWHCDPDRRAGGRRTTHGELFEPPLEAIAALLRRNPHGAIKVAPATEIPESWRESAERQWLGSRGECRQQVAWFGSLARHPGQHSATVVDAPGGPHTIAGAGDEPIPLAPSLGRFLYEPHNAVLAAKLTGALCGQHNLAAVSPGIAYLTSDVRATDAALDAFEVLNVVPFDQKQLKAWCREHRIGRLEVKKRGVELDPESLRKTIIADGDAAGTLIVAPLGKSTRAIVARRV